MLVLFAYHDVLLHQPAQLLAQKHRLAVQRVLDLQGQVVAALLKGPPHAKAEPVLSPKSELVQAGPSPLLFTV